MSIWEIFKLGGPVMWLLLAASILAMGIILDRCSTFYRWRQKSDAGHVFLRKRVGSRR